VKAAAQRDCGMLLSGMKSKADSRACGPTSLAMGRTSGTTNSTSQMALLGVWACNQAGREVPMVFWKEAENAWKAHQMDDGGWSYIYKAQASTAGEDVDDAGRVATLFIAQDYVHLTDGSTAKETCSTIGWSRDQVDLRPHRGGVSGGYVLYGMERVRWPAGTNSSATTTGIKSGAQRWWGTAADGSWARFRRPAFAVIFLSRGRAPVILNKFEYELEGRRPKGQADAAGERARRGGGPERAPPRSRRCHVSRATGASGRGTWRRHAVDDGPDGAEAELAVISHRNTVDDYHTRRCFTWPGTRS